MLSSNRVRRMNGTCSRIGVARQMHTRSTSEMSISNLSASSRTFSSSSLFSLTVRDFSRLSAIAYSGQFQRLKAAKRCPNIITATPKYMIASGMAQTSKPLTVKNTAKPKKNPARNSNKAVNCLLLASCIPQATRQVSKLAPKNNIAGIRQKVVSGIRSLREGGYIPNVRADFPARNAQNPLIKQGKLGRNIFPVAMAENRIKAYVFAHFSHASVSQVM